MASPRPFLRAARTVRRQGRPCGPEDPEVGFSEVYRVCGLDELNSKHGSVS